ncbi:MAG: bifunctional diaminohydroxyphosphoribosylaminopyrimidine deaminase/5-amino-6-(5-phosphoribosylamino)uracil reductase, partial [Candidatus Poseidoniaceae archaeon]|nr:bifunctional diaminohydroxyphosphoribosylaminopyrimidine deaminase/5-amino-6-(5-phosphoribosylamino)uracil reductase [Candidatus Poseidoniaceae archaeon]
IQRVVIAHPDPNPNVRGRGSDVLREAGLEVEVGLLQDEASVQMRSFLHWCHHRRPWVTVKVAVDANGSVDDRSEDAGRFTSEGCLDEVHRLRQRCDAVLVGSETVLRDDPLLTVRRVEHDRQPLRVVLDGRGRVSDEAALLNDGGSTMHLTGEVELERLLQQLGDQELQRLLVEGGPSTVHRFLKAGLVDEVFLVHSTTTHASPVPSGLDDEAFASAGLTPQQGQVWGEEQVSVWLRA